MLQDSTVKVYNSNIVYNILYIMHISIAASELWTVQTFFLH